MLSTESFNLVVQISATQGPCDAIKKDCQKDLAILVGSFQNQQVTIKNFNLIIK